MIEVKNLSFSYTSKPFMRDIDFHVNDGEIFGFLGPSGAGKSTLQKILTGSLGGFGGSVIVNGHDMRHADVAYYETIGVDFEFPSLYEKLSGRDNLSFFSSLYKKHLDMDFLLKAIGLHHDGEKKVMHYSKGMKSRLNFIKALIHDPQLLFLDEPTSGLDPSNARIMKDMILAEKKRGKTILLTTHNMHDAEELCDRVAFLFDGAIIAIDSPKTLIMSRGAAKINYGYRLNGIEHIQETHLSETSQDQTLLQALASNSLTHIHSSEPNLNDIFIELTGRTLQ